MLHIFVFSCRSSSLHSHNGLPVSVTMHPGRITIITNVTSPFTFSNSNARCNFCAFAPSVTTTLKLHGPLTCYNQDDRWWRYMSCGNWGHLLLSRMMDGFNSHFLLLIVPFSEKKFLNITSNDTRSVIPSIEFANLYIDEHASLGFRVM